MNVLERTVRWFTGERRAVYGTPGDYWAATAHPVTLATLKADALLSSPAYAERISTVAACVQLIAGALATLPFYVYGNTEGRRREVSGHPLRRFLTPAILESWIRDGLLHGNGLIAVDRDDAGAMNGLRYVPWSWVTVQRTAAGRIVFDVREPGRDGAAGPSYRLLRDDALHLADASDDGVIGRSRLSRSADTVAAVHTANETARAYLDNGMTPSLALEVPGTMTPEQKAAMRAQLNERHTGSRNAGRALVLDGGIVAKPLQISPEDAELLASRKFGVEECCRLYQVPPPLVQDYSHNTFSNSETAGRWFAQFTLTPWARKVEAEFARGALAPGEELELDLSAFLRGDPQTRWAAHKIALDANVLTVDEVRGIEGFDPMPAGEPQA